MTSPSPGITPPTGRARADYGVALLRDRAFEAVYRLWRKRQAAGVTQKQIADAIGRDPAWVSRTLRGSGNWTLRTVAELVQALDGEAEIEVAGLEEPVTLRRNYNAYDGYCALPTTDQPASPPASPLPRSSERVSAWAE